MRTKEAAAAVQRIGIAALEERLGVERSTIARWIREGDLPRAHYVGTRRAWFIAEIEAWELRRMARGPQARRGARGGAAK